MSQNINGRVCLTKFSRLNRDEHFEIHKLEAVECIATRVK